jgi:hypothetical protein
METEDIEFGGNDYDSWIISNCQHCQKYYDLDNNGYPQCQIIDLLIGGHGEISQGTVARMGLEIVQGVKDFNSRCNEFVEETDVSKFN